MTRPIQEWHKVHVIQEYVQMTGFHIQLQKRNHHEEPCFSEILQELISDLTQLDSVTNYQEGEMWESLWKNDKQWKGSPNKMQSGTLGKVGLKYTVYKYSQMQSWLHEKRMWPVLRSILSYRKGVCSGFEVHSKLSIGHRYTVQKSSYRSK